MITNLHNGKFEEIETPKDVWDSLMALLRPGTIAEVMTDDD